MVCEGLELDRLTFPFDLEIWYGDRVAVLGANGTGKSHFLRLLARGGNDPDAEHPPVDGGLLAPVPHAGRARLGARVRPGHFSQTHDRPDLRIGVWSRSCGGGTTIGAGCPARRR